MNQSLAARPFTDSLREYRNGALVRHLTEAQAEVLAAVVATRKAGAVTLKLKFVPEDGSPNGVTVEAAVSTTVPKKSLPKAVFFVNDGGLFRNDPMQGEMFTESVDPTTGEVTERPVLRAHDGGRSDAPRPSAQDGEGTGTAG